MKKIYLDHAATTPIDEEVIQLMYDSMRNTYGNPSSTHSFGRESKSLLEAARNKIADFLHVSASEIIFTSSGTESNNFVLKSAVKDLKIGHIITSKIEHHAVLNVVKSLENEHSIKVSFVNILPNGLIDLNHLQVLLSKSAKIKTLVSLMHVNNEIGAILDLEKVSQICKENNVLFHSDTVQSLGNFPLNFSKLCLDFAVGSAHKFNGPKGVGFLFVKKSVRLKPHILGGNQEKGMRASTENLHSILGMAKALEINLNNLENNLKKIEALKSYCVQELQNNFEGIKFVASSNSRTNCSHKILSVILPVLNPMVLFQLDMKGIALSSGSACQSGAAQNSHVIEELLPNNNKTILRISFGKSNTKEEIDRFINELKSLLN